MAQVQAQWKSTLGGEHFKIGECYDFDGKGEPDQRMFNGRREYCHVSTNVLDVFGLNNNSKMLFHGGKLKVNPPASECLYKHAYSPPNTCLFFRYVKIYDSETQMSTATLRQESHYDYDADTSYMAEKILSGVEFVLAFTGRNIAISQERTLLQSFADFTKIRHGGNSSTAQFDWTSTFQYDECSYYGDIPCPWTPANIKPSLKDIYEFYCSLSVSSKHESAKPKFVSLSPISPAVSPLTLPFQVADKLISKTHMFYEKMSIIRNRILELEKTVKLPSPCIEEKLKTFKKNIRMFENSFKQLLEQELPLTSQQDEDRLLEVLTKKEEFSPFKNELLDSFFHEIEADIFLINMCFQTIEEAGNISFCQEDESRYDHQESPTSVLALEVYFLHPSKCHLLQQMIAYNSKEQEYEYCDDNNLLDELFYLREVHLQRNLEKLLDAATKGRHAFNRKFKICEFQCYKFSLNEPRIKLFQLDSNNALDDVTVSLCTKMRFWSPTFGQKFPLGGLYDINMNSVKNQKRVPKTKRLSSNNGASINFSTNVFSAFNLNNTSIMRYVGEKICPAQNSPAYRCLKETSCKPLNTYIVFRYVFIENGTQLANEEHLYTIDNLGRCNSQVNFAAVKILHGLEAIFVFTGADVASAKQVDNLNRFAVAIKNDDEPSLSDDIEFHYEDCLYYGDIPFDTMNSKMLSKIHQFCIDMINDNHSIPKSVYLASTSEIFNASDTFVSNCHKTILIYFSRITTELSKLQQDVTNTLKNCFPALKSKTEEFRKCFEKYRDEFQKKMSSLIPFQSANDEYALRYFFENQSDSPFQAEKLNNWLQKTRTEIKLAQMCIEKFERFTADGHELSWNYDSVSGEEAETTNITDNCLSLKINFVKAAANDHQLNAMKNYFVSDNSPNGSSMVDFDSTPSLEGKLHRVFEKFNKEAEAIEPKELEDWSFKIYVSSDSAHNSNPFRLHKHLRDEDEEIDYEQEMAVEFLKVTCTEIQFKILQPFLNANEVFKVKCNPKDDSENIDDAKVQNCKEYRENEIKICNLQPFTEYELITTIELNNGTEDHYVTHDTCKTSFPPPQHLIMKDSQINSISIEWHANSLIEDTKNSNFNYRVSYWKDSDRDLNLQKKHTTSDTSCELSELSPCTTYIIEVARFSLLQADYHENGTIQKSFSTKCPIPNKVEIESTPMNDSCMSLTWKKPSENFDFVDQYKITYLQNNSEPHTSVMGKPIIVDRDTLSVTIKDLLSNMEYKFYVFVVTKDKQEIFAEHLAKTNDPIPLAPGKPTVKKTSHNSVEITLENPPEYASRYELEIHHRESDQDVTLAKNVIVQLSLNAKPEWPIFHLQPKLIYFFKIRACNTTGEGQYSVKSNEIKIFEKFQPGQPKAVQTFYDRIEIVWDKPYDHKQVTNYKVMYTTNSQKWTTVPDSIKENNFVVRELKPETQYSFKVESVAETNSTSEVSDPIKTTSAIPSAPGKPNCIDIENNYITINWQKPQQNPDTVIKYKIDYYDAEGLRQNFTAETNGLVEKLKVKKIKNTDGFYRFKVMAVSKHGNSDASPLSDIIQTKQRPILDIILKCDKISENPTIYQLPTEISHTDQKNKIEMQIFSSKPISDVRKVLLIVGATGTGKTTLINSIVNYLFGVEWNDNFRLKLIKEFDKSRTESATTMITSYTLELEDSTIITIVDTPGFADTGGIERDETIKKQMKMFFDLYGGENLNAVVFVARIGEYRLTPAQKHIFNTIFALFGKNIQQILHVFCTFSDGSDPAILEAMSRERIECKSLFQVNNRPLYVPEKKKRERDRLDWTENTDSFKRFFECFRKAQPVTLCQTREVILNRDQIDLIMDDLFAEMKNRLDKIQQLESVRVRISKNKVEIEKNSNFKVEYPFSYIKKKNNCDGEFTTNCNDCKKSCHYPCEIKRDIDKHKCKVMGKRPNLTDDNNCVVCECNWRKHSNDNYHYVKVDEMFTKTIAQLKKQYNIALDEKASTERLLHNLEEEIRDVEVKIDADRQRLQDINENLKSIALKQNSGCDLDYIESLIRVEEQKGNMPHARVLRHLKERENKKRKVLDSLR